MLSHDREATLHKSLERMGADVLERNQMIAALRAALEAIIAPECSGYNGAAEIARHALGQQVPK